MHYALDTLYIPFQDYRVKSPRIVNFEGEYTKYTIMTINTTENEDSSLKILR